MIKKIVIVTGFLMLMAGCTFNGRKDMQALPDQAAAGDDLVAQVCGTVAYLERIALPPDAVVRVTLSDVSLQDAPSRIIAEKTFTAHGRQVPIPFCLKYRSDDIDPRQAYQVRAEIMVGGRRRFATDTAYPVITGGAPERVDIWVVSARAGTVGPSGGRVENVRWELAELHGQAVTAAAGSSLPWFRLASEGKRVSGFDGCNRFFGSYKREGASLGFASMGSTMMACPPGVTIDRGFMAALAAAASCKVVGSRLEIYDGEGGLLARFESR